MEASNRRQRSKKASVQLPTTHQEELQVTEAALEADNYWLLHSARARHAAAMVQAAGYTALPSRQIHEARAEQTYKSINNLSFPSSLSLLPSPATILTVCKIVSLQQFHQTCCPQDQMKMKGN
jgi:hypothetical protein